MGWKREFQLRKGAGLRLFIGLECEIGKGNRAGYGISIQTWLLPKLTSAKFASWRKWILCVKLCQVSSNEQRRLCTLSGFIKRIHYCLTHVSIRPYDSLRSKHLATFWTRGKLGRASTSRIVKASKRFFNNFSKGANYLIWSRLPFLGSIHCNVQIWFAAPRPTASWHPRLDQQSRKSRVFTGTGSAATEMDWLDVPNSTSR